MAYTESSIRYNFSLTVGEDSWGQTFSPEFSGRNMTDALAFDFLDAWLGLPWPAGTAVSGIVTKTDTSNTTRTGDTTARTFS